MIKTQNISEWYPHMSCGWRDYFKSVSVRFELDVEKSGGVIFFHHKLFDNLTYFCKYIPIYQQQNNAADIILKLQNYSRFLKRVLSFENYNFSQQNWGYYYSAIRFGDSGSLVQNQCNILLCFSFRGKKCNILIYLCNLSQNKSYHLLQIFNEQN